MTAKDEIAPGARFLEGDRGASRWTVKKVIVAAGGLSRALIVKDGDPNAQRLVTFEHLRDQAKYKRLR